MEVSILLPSEVKENILANGSFDHEVGKCKVRSHCL